MVFDSQPAARLQHCTVLPCYRVLAMIISNHVLNDAECHGTLVSTGGQVCNTGIGSTPWGRPATSMMIWYKEGFGCRGQEWGAVLTTWSRPRCRGPRRP